MKISKIKVGILFIFVIVVLIEGITFASTQVSAEKIEESENLNLEEKKILELVNQYREENNLEKLVPISSLQEVAKLKVDDLSKNAYFSHTSPTFGTPFDMLKSKNVDYSLAGENLARGGKEELIVEAWINSKSHKENILEKRFKFTGISVINDKIYGKMVVQIFAELK